MKKREKDFYKKRDIAIDKAQRGCEHYIWERCVKCKPLIEKIEFFPPLNI